MDIVTLEKIQKQVRELKDNAGISDVLDLLNANIALSKNKRKSQYIDGKLKH